MRLRADRLVAGGPEALVAQADESDLEAALLARVAEAQRAELRERGGEIMREAIERARGNLRAVEG